MMKQEKMRELLQPYHIIVSGTNTVITVYPDIFEEFCDKILIELISIIKINMMILYPIFQYSQSGGIGYNSFFSVSIIRCYFLQIYSIGFYDIIPQRILRRRFYSDKRIPSGHEFTGEIPDKQISINTLIFLSLNMTKSYFLQAHLSG
jgi:hypothetical protein